MSNKEKRPSLWEPGIAEEVDALISECLDHRLLLFAFEGRVGLIAARGSTGISATLQSRILRLHNALTEFFYFQAHGYEERHGRPPDIDKLRRV
jgi:hypothetical protein